MQSNHTTQKTFKTKPNKSGYNDSKQANKGKTWKRTNDKREAAYN